MPGLFGSQAIPIIGGTGLYASGKTLFGLTICPEQTRWYDTEKSAESYCGGNGLPAERIDVPRELMARHPQGYKPIDTFRWWLDDIRAIKPGKYRVIGLDTASEIESGAVDWVRSNPAYFNRTGAQYARMEGLMWGDMKELWKAILSDLASRCEVFYFTVHMTAVYSDNKPTARKKPKGKSTLMELASLFLQFERKADPQGNVPAAPSATVLKSRLAHTRLTAAGIQILPVLPPRLPVATVGEIRRYVGTPPDYSKLKPEELAPEPIRTDDERADVRLATAEAEAETERFRVERLEKEEQASGRKTEEQARKDEARRRNAEAKAAGEVATATPAANGTAPTTPPANGTPTMQPAITTTATQPPPPAVSKTSQAATTPPATTTRTIPGVDPSKAGIHQLNRLIELKAEFFLQRGTADPDAQIKAWAAVLAKRGVTRDDDLTVAQAAELEGNLKTAIAAMAAEKAKAEGQPAAEEPAGKF